MSEGEPALRPDDVGHPVHYAAVPEGTAVFASDDRRVGEVLQVVDNYEEHILDGIVIRDTTDEIRFIDGPEVARTFDHAVLLSITAEEVARHGPPEDGPAVFGARRHGGGFLSRLLGAWKKR